MKKYWSLIIGTVWLAVGMVHAGPLEPGLVARVHFAGGDAVTADPNSAPLQKTWSTPEALALRAQTLDKLARFLDGWLRQAIAPNLVPAWQTRPLLADLCAAEWQLEVHQPAAGAVVFSLAVRLGENRAQAWQMALNPVLTGWKQSSPAHHGILVAKSGWLFFDLDNAPITPTSGAIDKLNHTWLTVDVDWARLAVWFPAVAKFDIPHTQLKITGADSNFEVAGRLFLSRPLSALEAWQFPTNIIHAPFVSFTAARGISDWLRQQRWADSLGINPLPDQVFTWVGPQLPYLAYAAMPLPNAAAVLPMAAGRVTTAVQSPDYAFGTARVESTDNQITLTGLPFMKPYLQARKEPSGNFLVGGFLPVFGRGQAVPPEIFALLSKPDLLFYHWENTAERLKIFPQLYQLSFLFTRHRQLEGGTAAYHWLQQLTPTLGPTVTTATEVSPTEIAFSRRAPAGLTAVELIALASWLEAPDFPGCDLRMPPRRIPNHPHPAPGAPAPFVLHPQ